MWRVALLCLSLLLAGCGFHTWSDLPFSSGSNPNLPVSGSENMRRVMGEQVPAPVLTPEPGDIWPQALPQTPTLQDLEKEGIQPQSEQPVPGSPQSRQGQSLQPPTLPPPPATRGSSTPPPSAQPGLPPPRQPSPGTPTVQVPPSGQRQGGQTIQTQHGPGVTTGGTGAYQTLTTPGGGTAIVVPNGNGTSTIIHSDGTIETVPTPK